MNTKLFLTAFLLPMVINCTNTGQATEAFAEDLSLQRDNNRREHSNDDDMLEHSNKIIDNQNYNIETRIEKRMRKEKEKINKINDESENLMYQYSPDFVHDIKTFFEQLITKSKNDNALLKSLKKIYQIILMRKI